MCDSVRACHGHIKDIDLAMYSTHGHFSRRYGKNFYPISALIKNLSMGDNLNFHHWPPNHAEKELLDAAAAPIHKKYPSISLSLFAQLIFGRDWQDQPTPIVPIRPFFVWISLVQVYKGRFPILTKTLGNPMIILLDITQNNQSIACKDLRRKILDFVKSEWKDKFDALLEKVGVDNYNHDKAVVVKAVWGSRKHQQLVLLDNYDVKKNYKHKKKEVFKFDKVNPKLLRFEVIVSLNYSDKIDPHIVNSLGFGEITLNSTDHEMHKEHIYEPWQSILIHLVSVNDDWFEYDRFSESRNKIFWSRDDDRFQHEIFAARVKLLIITIVC